LKTIQFVLDFFGDERYKLLLETWLKRKNVWLHEDGRITICLTDDDIKFLEKLPRLYRDVDNLNKELLFMREKGRLFRRRGV